MKQNLDLNELNIKVESYGDIDFEYYFIKADLIRARHISRMASDTKKSIKAALASFYEKYLCLHCHRTSH